MTAVARVDQLVAWTPGGLDDIAWIGAKLAAHSVQVYLRAARILATSQDLPWLLRILFVVGLIQIPVLPFDEIALAIALAWLALWHRDTLRGALRKARGD